ncbi:hypothetical protein RI138_09190 [Streptomyces sp. C11-1]|uniref:Uncharacterized protein n=1 Tax=Streptomyces durocortorensis TaxID=2811104 RepID=A0ABY9VSW5_9ACTN|nr:hypothetical protein [Streptomyces durocortorensis]WNF26997.1 hypothetical protein RI138_09190 [Streptomyces durocortorensis]
MRTVEEALRTWLPLISELQPVSVAVEAAHPDGLRGGFLADLLVVHPLPEGGAAGDGAAPDRLLASVGTLARRLGLDPAGFVADEDGVGGVLNVRGEGEGPPCGAYLILALTGADPLDPEGEEAEHVDPGEGLP